MRGPQEANALYRLRATRGVRLRKKRDDTRLEAAPRRAISIGNPSHRTGILRAAPAPALALT